MNYVIEKVKLPASQSYPLKTSELNAVLKKTTFDEEKIISLTFHYKQHPELLFETFFAGLKVKAIAVVNRGKIFIRIYAVDRKERSQLSSELITTLEKYYVPWLNQLEENKFDWCNESKGFYVWCRKGKIEVNC